MDARLVEAEGLHLGDDIVPDLLVAALLRGRERFVVQLVVNVLVLQAAQPFVGVGDVVERLDDPGLELGLDGAERERILYVVDDESPSAAPSGFSPPPPSSSEEASCAGLNGFAVAGAASGAGVCASAGTPGIARRAPTAARRGQLPASAWPWCWGRHRSPRDR